MSNRRLIADSLALPLLVTLVLLAWFVGAAAAADKSRDFVSGLEDLPLMPGLTEVEAGGVVFDKPGGRIVEAVAQGRLPSGKVQAFYADTLPQLGWRATAPGRFVRDGERLAISTAGDNGQLTVRFSIAPH